MNFTKQIAPAMQIDAFDATKTGGDGYSIDEAVEAFERGVTAHAYVAMVVSRDRYQGRR